MYLIHNVFNMNRKERDTSMTYLNMKEGFTECKFFMPILRQAIPVSFSFLHILII